MDIRVKVPKLISKIRLHRAIYEIMRVGKIAEVTAQMMVIGNKLVLVPGIVRG